MPDIRVSISKELHQAMKRAAIDQNMFLADLIRKTLALEFTKKRLTV